MGFREKLIIFGVLPWVVAILLLIFLILPSITVIQEKSTYLNDKETELDTITKSIKKQKDTSKIKNEIEEIENSLRGFNLEFPENDDLEKLYVDIQTALNNTQLKLDKLSVSKESSVKFPKDFFLDESSDKENGSTSKKKKKVAKKTKKGKTVLPATIIKRSFKIDMNGSYQGIVDLVNYLNSYYRFITLENISVKENTDTKLLLYITNKEKELTTSLIFSVYKYRKNEAPVETDKKDDDKDKDKAKDKE